MTLLAVMAQFGAFLLLALLAATADGGGGGGDTSVVLEGSPTSYAQFRPWRGGANATLELEFSAPSQRDALLLYADSRASGEYVQLSLAGGAARLRFNWGAGRAGSLTAGRDLAGVPGVGKGENKRTWHHVLVLNSGGETTLVVDGVFRDATSFGKRNQNHRGGGRGERPGYLASPGGNQSYVYVGGLPSWYVDRSELLAQPLALLEPRLQGAVRNLRYRAAGAPAFGRSRDDDGRKRRKKGKDKKRGGGGGKRARADVVGRAEAVQEMMAYKVNLAFYLLTYLTLCSELICRQICAHSFRIATDFFYFMFRLICRQICAHSIRSYQFFFRTERLSPLQAISFIFLPSLSSCQGKDLFPLNLCPYCFWQGEGEGA